MDKSRSAPSNPPKRLKQEETRHADFGDAQDASAIGPDAGKRSREEGHDAGGICINRVEPREQERRKRDQASTAGERVERAAEERGRSQHDVCDHEIPVSAAW